MPLVSISQLIDAAKSGQLVSFPTDTVPALATLPSCSELIFSAKQRQQDKPLILMGAGPQDLWPYVVGTTAEFTIWKDIIAQHWPGQLTLVLPASELVPRAMNPLDPHTIGIRVPAASIAREILAHTGPLATTSANLSGQPPLVSPQEIDRTFANTQVLNWCDSFTASGQPSTVAKWMGDNWQIIRQGGITI
ncbi:MAG: putative threonylcarbamoyl-AMP synthase [Chroococcopsis gigantea SAG 12.99]|jgi:L-threonylcarbamoyladenylate synthase|nr:L-threonylcarbamoyladenylate synthase [Chlorogloea purpurea SAG 13.99]MDV2998605.1 putative threonylcarbamoyl-AMP synthase [Chroococcopsis gigantea SAG 12.99]